MESIRIINNSNHVLSTNVQNIIRKCVTNIGNIDEVQVNFDEIEYNNEGCHILPIYHVLPQTDEFEQEEIFLFAINLTKETVIVFTDNPYFKEIMSA